MMVFTITSFSQAVTLSGSVRNKTNAESVPSVSVTVRGSSTGTFTDENGNFKLTVPKVPVTLIFSSVGFETQEVTVNEASSNINIEFLPGTSLGQEVVVAASRTPERILESPVTIERVSSATIRNAPASNYYDVVANLKGVDVVASSLTFKTPTTRGFSGSGNLRFNQIVDGMDNQAPGLNFSVGSVIGLTELDVDNMELLPGASSALFGPGGMNGTLLINSKNPFRYQGLTFQIKTGIMHIDDRERNESPYHNWSVRWGKKVSEKFAFKIGSELIQAKDWVADDYRNYKRFGTNGFITQGTRTTDPGYDGINVYGDEIPSAAVPTFRTVLGGIAAAAPFLSGYIGSITPGIPADMKISRTGYTENEIVDPNTINFKLSGAAHYKLTSKIEAVLAGNWGTGNTVYTGSQRYSLKNLKVGQYKLELNSDRWFVRGYTTQENAGESHNLTVTTILLNQAWKAEPQWQQQYALAYLNARQSGQSDITAHNSARAVADIGRPAPGSTEFKTLYDRIRKIPISQGGGLFLDKSDLYMAEGQYKFSEEIKFADVLVGGNWKQYVLNSEGTLFADTKGNPIKINEYGTYVQVGKEIVPDFLKLTASGRYDKNENFEGRFTPRVTAVIKPAQDHNVRLSYQTAYRFPSTQQQWIDLFVGSGQLIGSNEVLLQKYNLINDPGNAVNANGTLGEKIINKEVKPESVTTFETGYKSLIAKKLLIDAYGYYGTYQDFITRRDVIQTSSSKGFSIVVNSPEKVKTYGWGLSSEYLLPMNFVVNGSVSSDKIKDVPQGFRAFFNTPELRTFLGLGNTGFGPKSLLGFNVAWRWQKGFFYENDFNQGDVPAYHVVDAAVSLKQPKIKSLIKFGATNIGNQYYRTAIGNPSIGGLYYLSFAYNVL
jgi:outer membrane receptor protein involved in Fe transport